MWIVNLDEEIKIPDKSGGVEVVKAGDLIRRKMKDIRLQLVYMAHRGPYEGTDNLRSNISGHISDIADILGIPGTGLTEEELDAIFMDLW